MLHSSADKSTLEYVSLDPAHLAREQQYRLLSGAVIPRPIALISTDGPAGRNAAPFSFFNAIGCEPPMIVFSASPRQDGVKDTIANIQDTREFVVHIVNTASREAMNFCAIDFKSSVDEIEKAGLATAPSLKVRPLRLIDFPVQLECQVIHMLRIGRVPYDLVVAEVVYFHFRSDIVNDRYHVDVTKLDPLGRLSGSLYTSVANQIVMPRLPVPSDSK